MKRTRYLTSLTLAALVGAAPAWAQFTESATTATTSSKPLCSELNHPNAGKLADKDTGMAGERSSSRVHQDCIADPQASAQAGTNSAATNGASTNGASTNSAAVTQGSSIAGSSTDTNTSVTGSTSTVSPNIDLRGRSSVTIDSAATTGNQSVDTTSSATTGNQSSTQAGSASSTSGDRNK